VRIAIASGKGGTGKTTVSTNLAWVAASQQRSVSYVDCDVEEPNGHLFLRPSITDERPVDALVPVVDDQLCNLCGLCGEICQFSAITPIGEKVLVFPEMCHSCGGCKLVCKPGAISEIPRTIGSLSLGKSDTIAFAGGLLNIGEPMSPPVIRAVKAAAPEVDITIIDAPPGTSCPVIESLKGAEMAVLVTEPTPFGLHDLGLAADMMREIGMPCCVVVNRAAEGRSDVEAFCKERDLDIIARLPDDRRVAEAYSRGILASEALEEFRTLFENLLAEIEART